MSANSRSSMHGQWSSRWVFVLAATGSAVGLGNIWKFPYIVGENGGGAFVLVYLLCIATIGLPVMIAEVMLGRRGRQSPINTMKVLSQEAGRSPLWQLLGWFGVLAGFLILSYYSVIAGWAINYVIEMASGTFTGTSAGQVKTVFDELLGDPLKLTLWHTLFIVVTMVMVAHGVRGGLEKALILLMPALFILLIILLIYAMNSGAFMQGLAFLFTPDFSALTGKGVLIAMGHAFFTLSLGMGAIMVYGSYMRSEDSIARTSIMIVIADTVVALIAGMAIFPIVFANGLEPSAGPGLVFQTLPLAFGQMTGGLFFGTLFFILLLFAAWSSSISLIEPAVAWLVESGKLKRRTASIICGVATWVLGMGTVLSFNRWAEVKLFDMTFFELLDFLAANIMLPLGGLFIALFVGWAMSRESKFHEMGTKHLFAFNGWNFLLKYVAPLAVLVVFLQSTGLLEKLIEQLS
ncbi:MAG: sodium-dependent transporter [Thiotrichaceae bacterium]|nr:sodium-dependent transporter [Thiotrichaceae bacterium]